MLDLICFFELDLPYFVWSDLLQIPTTGGIDSAMSIQKTKIDFELMQVSLQLSLSLTLSLVLVIVVVFVFVFCLYTCWRWSIIFTPTLTLI